MQDQLSDAFRHLSSVPGSLVAQWPYITGFAGIEYLGDMLKESVTNATYGGALQTIGPYLASGVVTLANFSYYSGSSGTMPMGSYA